MDAKQNVLHVMSGNTTYRLAQKKVVVNDLAEGSNYTHPGHVLQSTAFVLNECSDIGHIRLDHVLDFLKRAFFKLHTVMCVHTPGVVCACAIALYPSVRIYVSGLTQGVQACQKQKTLPEASVFQPTRGKFPSTPDSFS